jgi:predicted Zn finger-like uncharacterized protein
MRLTCPNCGAEYEVSDGMIPAAGRHVQCTACHTRWFVRGAAGTGLTEDQILRRLETWSPGPRPLPAPAPVAPVVAPVTVTAPAGSAEPETKPEPQAKPHPDRPSEPPVVVHLPARPAAPAKPADRPAVARPTPLTAPARTQPSSRLDLGEPAAPPAPAPPAPESRFARGLLLALVLAALALAAYVWRDPIASRVPQARAALTVYGETIDGWRDRIEEQIGRFRGGEPPT